METAKNHPTSHAAHTLEVNALLSSLHTSEKGLSQSEVDKRLQEYGYNQLTEKKPISAFSIFLRQWNNTLILILLGAVALVLAVYFFGEREQSDLIEAGLIFLIILMITILGFLQEYKAEKALSSLKKLLAFRTTVRRDTKEKEVDFKDLVPGDIVIIEEGLKVPADIRVIQSASLYANEASLTGESLPVAKNNHPLSAQTVIADQKNMLFAGTVISSGRGIGVVVKTGDATEIGKIAGLVSSAKAEKTPTQRQLDRISKMIGYAILGICAVVFVSIVFFTPVTSVSVVARILSAFVAAVALAVAAIPEGLPAVVTITLAIGTQRMAKKNALIRKLTAVETLGSVDIICTDKTGTLTKNEMTVKEIYTDNRLFTVEGNGYETKGTFTIDGKTADVEDIALLLEAGMYCNNSRIEPEGMIGDPTELALLVSARKADLDPTGERLVEIPFSSERKMMSVIIKEKNNILLFAKGAPEVVLSHCTHEQINGRPSKLSATSKKHIVQQAEAMNEKALRTLGFAYVKLTQKHFEQLKDDYSSLEKDLTFIGLQGLIDPAREEVKELIEKCTTSGIRVVMITGDHAVTAKSIGHAIGIKGEVMTGEEVDAMSESEFKVKVEKVGIFARVNPNTKMKIVDSLKKLGHIVAMTGDGVNDAPALKKADIGIAMGITGTDVAKEAADMVLLDDQFSTIVSAIEEGRGIYVNIRKFVHYILAGNIGEVIFVFLCVMLYKELPLSATMLLWLNVITDGLPAVALGVDRPAKNIMDHNPKIFQETIISKKVGIEMLLFGLTLATITGVMYHLNIMGGTHEQASGAAFIGIAFFELVYLFIVRSGYGSSLFTNKWLWWAIYYTFLLQISIVVIPLFANIFGVTNINANNWLYILIVSTVLIPVFITVKKVLGKV